MLSQVQLRLLPWLRLFATSKLLFHHLLQVGFTDGLHVTSPPGDSLIQNQVPLVSMVPEGTIKASKGEKYHIQQSLLRYL